MDHCLGRPVRPSEATRTQTWVEGAPLSLVPTHGRPADLAHRVLFDRELCSCPAAVIAGPPSSSQHSRKRAFADFGQETEYQQVVVPEELSLSLGGLQFSNDAPPDFNSGRPISLNKLQSRPGNGTPRYSRVLPPEPASPPPVDVDGIDGLLEGVDEMLADADILRLLDVEDTPPPLSAAVPTTLAGVAAAAAAGAALAGPASAAGESHISGGASASSSSRHQPLFGLPSPAPRQQPHGYSLSSRTRQRLTLQSLAPSNAALQQQQQQQQQQVRLLALQAGPSDPSFPGLPQQHPLAPQVSSPQLQQLNPQTWQEQQQQQPQQQQHLLQHQLQQQQARGLAPSSVPCEGAPLCALIGRAIRASDFAPSIAGGPVSGQAFRSIAGGTVSGQALRASDIARLGAAGSHSGHGPRALDIARLGTGTFTGTGSNPSPASSQPWPPLCTMPTNSSTGGGVGSCGMGGAGSAQMLPSVELERSEIGSPVGAAAGGEWGANVPGWGVPPDLELEVQMRSVSLQQQHQQYRVSRGLLQQSRQQQTPEQGGPGPSSGGAAAVLPAGPPSGSSSLPALLPSSPARSMSTALGAGGVQYASNAAAALSPGGGGISGAGPRMSARQLPASLRRAQSVAGVAAGAAVDGGATGAGDLGTEQIVLPGMGVPVAPLRLQSSCPDSYQQHQQQLHLQRQGSQQQQPRLLQRPGSQQLVRSLSGTHSFGHSHSHSHSLGHGRRSTTFLGAQEPVSGSGLQLQQQQQQALRPYQQQQRLLQSQRASQILLLRNQLQQQQQHQEQLQQQMLLLQQQYEAFGGGGGGGGGGGQCLQQTQGPSVAACEEQEQQQPGMQPLSCVDQRPSAAAAAMMVGVPYLMSSYDTPDAGPRASVVRRMAPSRFAAAELTSPPLLTLPSQELQPGSSISPIAGAPAALPQPQRSHQQPPFGFRGGSDAAGAAAAAMLPYGAYGTCPDAHQWPQRSASSPTAAASDATDCETMMTEGASGGGGGGGGRGLASYGSRSMSQDCEGASSLASRQEGDGDRAMDESGMVGAAGLPERSGSGRQQLSRSISGAAGGHMVGGGEEREGSLRATPQTTQAQTRSTRSPRAAAAPGPATATATTPPTSTGIAASGAGGGSGAGTPPPLVPQMRAAQRAAAVAAAREAAGATKTGRPRQRTRTISTLADVIRFQLIVPGPHQLLVGNQDRVDVMVHADGRMECAHGEFRSVSSLALAVLRQRNPNRRACDGWQEVRLNGVRLDEMRQEAVRLLAQENALAAAAPPPPQLPPDAETE